VNLAVKRVKKNLFTLFLEAIIDQNHLQKFDEFNF
jgi:hypothetical protein